MTIEVSQGDIDEGLRGVCASCPVALAVNRALGVHDAKIAVGTYSVVGGRWFNLPESARSWIVTFDRIGPSYVKPFTFELEFIA